MTSDTDTGLAERLRNLRVVLKSGEYDGADLMRAWCAMVDAADTIEQLQAELEAALSRPSADFAAVVEQCAREADDIGKRYHYSTDRCACQRTSTAELIAAAIRSIQAPDEGGGL